MISFAEATPYIIFVSGSAITYAATFTAQMVAQKIDLVRQTERNNTQERLINEHRGQLEKGELKMEGFLLKTDCTKNQTICLAAQKAIRSSQHGHHNINVEGIEKMVQKAIDENTKCQQMMKKDIAELKTGFNNLPIALEGSMVKAIKQAVQELK